MEFRDYYKIQIPTALKESKDEWKDYVIPGGQSKGLDINIVATHAGLFNDNLRFYIPSRMEDGVAYFNSARKPLKILKNHDTDKDPVGIITGGEYIHTVPDSLLHDSDVMLMLDSSVPVKKQVAAVKRFMKRGVPFTDEWEGLGYIRLNATILDKKTQEQVLDGRFDSVSTSFVSPGHAYCSECQQNWAEDGMCDHQPGESYSDDEDEDPVVCSLVPGVHKYKECSMVVFGADPITMISIGNNEDRKIYTMPVDIWNKNTDVSDSVFEFKDILINKEDPKMAQPEQTSLSDAEKTIFDSIKQLRPEMEDEKLVKFSKLLLSLKDENGKFPYQEEAELDDETAFLYALEDLETEDQVIDSDFIADELKKELAQMYKEGIVSKENYEATDAKLSTEGRKKLPDSTFCGPERSFPVPDCCLTGDTEIKLLNGEITKIKDLVDKENLWVYGFDLTKKAIVPAKVTKVWLAVKNAQIYKITLDNGKSIRATGNHPFLTKSGQYKRADELSVNDSLMPLYTKFAKSHNGLSSYEKIYQPWYNFWEYTHHMVGREYFDKPLGNNQHIHHINSNKFDNTPENLEQLSKSEHLESHFVPGSRENQVWVEFSKLCDAKLVNVKPFAGNIRRSKASIDQENPNKELEGTGISLLGIRELIEQTVPRRRIAEKLRVSDRTLVGWLEKANIDSHSTIKDIRKGKLYKKAIFNTINSNTNGMFFVAINALKEGKDLTKVSKETNLSAEAILYWANKAGEILPNTAKSSTASRNMISRNHSVVSIELDGFEDAYDMEVPATSNFALADGVFVHNSHVTAAKRLIGRYEGPGNKSKILACVNRKAKALGCDSDKSDSVTEDKVEVPDLVIPTCDTLSKASNNEILTLFVTAEAEAINRSLKLKRDCSECEASLARATKAEDGIKEVEDKVSELENTLTVLREELRRQYDDYSRQFDKTVDVGLELRQEKLEKLALMNVLSGKFKTLDEARENLKDKDLSKEETIVTDSFDLSAVQDKLFDGTARDPVGSIENPVVNIDNNNDRLPENLDGPALNAIDTLKEKLEEAYEEDDEDRRDYRIMLAKQFYDRMVTIGVLDSNLVPFERFTAKSN